MRPEGNIIELALVLCECRLESEEFLTTLAGCGYG